MDPADADAIADYLKGGGRIVKVQDTIAVTEDELLQYLRSRGEVKYQHGDARPYLHNNKRFSIDGLIRLANDYRHAETQPPFALRPETGSWRR